MKGEFKNKEKCIIELRKQGFSFYVQKNECSYFISGNEIAEINIYSDNSCSALIGRISKLKQTNDVNSVFITTLK